MRISFILYLFLILMFIPFNKTYYKWTVTVHNVLFDPNHPFEVFLQVKFFRVKSQLVLNKSLYFLVPPSRKLIYEFISNEPPDDEVQIEFNYLQGSNKKQPIVVMEKNAANGSNYTIVKTAEQGNYTIQMYPIQILFHFQQTCFKNYYGPKCQFCEEKDNHLGHYRCSSEGGIICNYGWRNKTLNCTQPFCILCVNGKCVAPFTCDCMDGYYGEGCEICRKKENCMNGYCILPGECLCYNSWKGQDCNKKIKACNKNSNCFNKGKCIKGRKNNSFCLCPPPFFGSLCRLKEIYPNYCQNKGKQFRLGKTNKCFCEPFFFGPYCSLLNSSDQCSSPDCLCENFNLYCNDFSMTPFFNQTQLASKKPIEEEDTTLLALSVILLFLLFLVMAISINETYKKKSTSFTASPEPTVSQK